MKSILLLMPYFGKWPDWIEFFLESCKANPSVDWLFFTDCGEPENRAPNVHFEPVTLEEYCRRASERIGLEFRTSNPYKLVDLKPAFGLIHADAARGYDFYGYGDVDVIYGDIRRFYADDLLARHQLLSTHRDRISGHLALFENTPRMHEAFRRIPDWRECLQDPAVRALDEGRFTKVFLRKKHHSPGLRRLYAWTSSWWRRNYFHEQYSTILSDRPWHDGSQDYPEVWTWRDGHLTNDADGDREFLYLHFMNWKSDRHLKRPGPAAWPSSPDGIIHMDWRDAGRNGFRITRRGFEPLRP